MASEARASGRRGGELGREGADGPVVAGGDIGDDWGAVTGE